MTLRASGDQNFTHAAFNDTGDLLFAWAYGQIDKLYCWRYEDGRMNQDTSSESPYETVSHHLHQCCSWISDDTKVKTGNPDLIKVIPYNTYHGCIVERPDKRLFPAQIRSTLRENRDPFPRNNEITLSHLQSACMFNDNSLVTVEKSFHRYLREYKINYSGTHILAQPGTEICRLKSSTDHASRILAVKQDDNVIIIACNRNATVEFVKVMPAPTRK